MQAANVLINQDGRVVLSDFGVTASLERATPSSFRVNSHAEASTSDAAGAGVSSPCLLSMRNLCLYIRRSRISSIPRMYVALSTSSWTQPCIFTGEDD